MAAERGELHSLREFTFAFDEFLAYGPRARLAAAFVETSGKEQEPALIISNPESPDSQSCECPGSGIHAPVRPES